MRELIAIGTMFMILAASGGQLGAKVHSSTCGLSNLAAFVADCQP